MLSLGVKTLARRVTRLAVCQHQQQRLRGLASRSLPLLSELPYHIVVGMPALSPTMDTGALAEWYVKEGDEFGAGDVLAKIETDKATIDFEAQDDGVVAKLLKTPGTGEDIAVGVPIMVTVEEADDVGAFSDFVAPASEAEAPAEPPVAAAAPEPVVPEPVAAPTPPPPAPVEATPPPAPVVVAAPVAEPTPVVAAAATGSISEWGKLARVSSPLAKTLGKQQQAYIETYGSTGQIPL